MGGSIRADSEVGTLTTVMLHRPGNELKFNGEKEQFENDPEADALLTREYRKPYVITDQV